MKKLLQSIVLACTLVVLTDGCTFDGLRSRNQTTELIATQDKIKGQAQIMVDTTVKALAIETNNTPPIQLARKSSVEAQRLLDPHPFYQFDVEGWVLSNKIARLEYEAQVKQDSALLKKEDSQKQVLDATNQRLVELGKIKEAEDNAKRWWQFWTWSGVTLSIAGVVCLCIFTPFGPMIISSLLAILWKIIPAVGSFFKVVGTKTLDNIVAGVENWKGKAMTAPVALPAPTTTSTEAKTYSASELTEAIKQERVNMVNLHRAALSSATDETDKKIIDHRVDAIATPIDVPKV